MRDREQGGISATAVQGRTEKSSVQRICECYNTIEDAERGVRRMCSVCMSIPCHPRCPNAPEPVPVHKCEKCGEGIFEGDKYFNGQEGYICEECLDDMSSSELLELVGESLATA